MKIKMRKYLVLATVALSLAFAACDDENNVNSSVLIENGSGSNVLVQLDTLYLDARIENLSGTMKYLWTVDGKEVSTASTYKFSQPKTGEYVIGLTVSDSNGETFQTNMTAKVEGRFGNGAFVLNEGNMSNETGTLTFIDSKGIAVDSAYYRVNQTLLGNVCQDLFISDNRIYILSQNGAKNGGEGLLTIADADNLEKVRVYNNTTLSWPTNLAVVGENLYIRDNKGVYMLNTSTDVLTLVEGTSGALKNRMAVVGEKTFVMGSKKLFVIQNGVVVHTISFEGALSGVAKAFDENLWVSCTSPASIIKINPVDYTIIDSHQLDVSIGAGWGVAPAFSAKDDIIYFSNAGFKLYRHIFSQDKTEEVANIKDYVEDAGIYYNSLGVDPVSGEVYFATLKGYAEYKTNDIAILDFTKSPVLQTDIKNKNSFPAGVFFTENFK